MILSRQVVRHIQKALKFSQNDIDGLMGNQTEKALEKFLKQNQSRIESSEFDSILSGGRKRKATAFGQIMAHEQSIDAGKIDGFLGPQTDFAFKQLLFLAETGKMPIQWRDRADTPNPHNFPNESRSQEQIREIYGKPGRSNQKRITLPYKHKLSWNLARTVRTTLCHEKVAESYEKVLLNVLEHYQMDGIRELGLDLFGGCFNKRKKRGGSTWSMHSWGIAVDYHPNKNQLRWGWDKAVFARPEYNKWWEFWEEEGWISLGRNKNFDWMHIQAARA